MKKSVFGLLFLVASSLVLVGLVIRQETTEIRSKAYDTQVVPIPSVLPTPIRPLQSPSLRLVASREDIVPGEKITLAIVAKSNQPTAEVKVGLRFNTQQVELIADDIRAGQDLPVVNLNEIESGNINVSFFISGDGEVPALMEESVVGTVDVRINGTSGETVTISIDRQTSGFYPPRSPEGEIGTNLLQSTQELVLHIK